MKLKKELIIGISVVIVLIIVVICVVLLTSNKSGEGEFTYDGRIDCMPPLSESQEDLCRRAEAAGYPYIAY